MTAIALLSLSSLIGLVLLAIPSMRSFVICHMLGVIYITCENFYYGAHVSWMILSTIIFLVTSFVSFSLFAIAFTMIATGRISDSRRSDQDPQGFATTLNEILKTRPQSDTMLILRATPEPETSDAGHQANIKDELTG